MKDGDMAACLWRSLLSEAMDAMNDLKTGSDGRLRLASKLAAAASQLRIAFGSDSPPYPAPTARVMIVGIDDDIEVRRVVVLSRVPHEGEHVREDNRVWEVRLVRHHVNEHHDAILGCRLVLAQFHQASGT